MLPGEPPGLPCLMVASVGSARLCCLTLVEEADLPRATLGLPATEFQLPSFSTPNAVQLLLIDEVVWPLAWLESSRSLFTSWLSFVRWNNGAGL